MKSSLPVVVLVDDEIEILNALKRIIRKFECQLHTFNKPEEALHFIEQNEVNVICSDHRMPKISGLELLGRAQALWPNSHRLMLSAYQDFDNIAHGFNAGIIQRFISKPWANKELELVFREVLSFSLPKLRTVFPDMLGESKAMLKLFALTRTAAGANAPIFIYGETGTGKELIARACHKLSHRKNEPFIAVNCANLSDQLIESQLFGHKKGAFTGAFKDQQGYLELAGNGTLFLDEITTLPFALQAKLLRVIQEREFAPLGSQALQQFTAQVLTASSTRMRTAVESGEFREDLYYRLAVIQLKIPNLADRERDALLLSKYFIDKYSAQQNKKFKGLSEDASDFVCEYSWPGNVRQLENLLHGVIILNEGPFITKAMLLTTIDESDKSIAQDQKHIESKTDTDIRRMADVEKEAILNAITKCNGNIVLAAKLLEINPSTIYRKMAKW